MTKLDSHGVKLQAQRLGIHQIGIASAQLAEDAAEVGSITFQRWLEKGYQADLAWMANPQRQSIYRVMPDVKSIICIAVNYFTPHPHSNHPSIAKISRYGWGRDYHRVLQKKLKALAIWLRAHSGQIRVRYYADTGPVQDKFWAQQAGLGWIAKNGNLITRKYGSWVFLGEILTNLSLQPDAPHTAHCGTCTRCIDACPTNAIAAPFVVDANRCIAYHTIENRTDKIPVAIAESMEGWVAGCDICQDVCPWNQRFAQETDISDFQPYPWNLHPPLAALENLDEAAWNRRFPASALRRIKPSMWRRNAKAARLSRRF